MAEDRSVQQMQGTGARVVQSSPGFAEKLAAAGKAPAKLTGAGRDDKDSIIQDLQNQLDSEKQKNRSLEDQFKYRIAHFMKRETQTKNKIDSLERRLNDGTDHDEHVQRMAVIENMHKSVIMSLDCIQTNTARILQEQEKDLMRAFRARLQEVSKDLEIQRSRKGEAGTEMQARNRRLVQDLKEAQELAQTFDKMNQQLTADNQKLQEKLRTRDDDRQCLLRELVLARKENARLKAQVKDGGAGGGAASGGETAQRTDSEAQRQSRTFSQKQIDQTRLQSTHNKQYEREVRYRDAITRLKRMVEAERRTTRTLKQQQADMLQQRTEIEVLLKQCLDDVKAEIMRHRLEQERKDGSSAPGPGVPITAMSVHELGMQDRERVLELLLSQQRVVQLLYSKAFPAQPPSPLPEDSPSAASPMPMKSGSGAGGGGTAKEDDFSWLSDIIPPDA